MSFLRRGHANLLCIVPILTDDLRRESALDRRGLVLIGRVSCAVRSWCSGCVGMRLPARGSGCGQKADSTLRYSQAVPDPSTNRALSRLISEVRRDPVHSTWYGRQRMSTCPINVLVSAGSQSRPSWMPLGLVPRKMDMYHFKPTCFWILFGDHPFSVERDRED